MKKLLQVVLMLTMMPFVKASTTSVTLEKGMEVKEGTTVNVKSGATVTTQGNIDVYGTIATGTEDPDGTAGTIVCESGAKVIVHKEKAFESVTNDVSTSLKTAVTDAKPTSSQLTGVKFYTFTREDGGILEGGVTVSPSASKITQATNDGSALFATNDQDTPTSSDWACIATKDSSQVIEFNGDSDTIPVNLVNDGINTSSSTTGFYPATSQFTGSVTLTGDNSELKEGKTKVGTLDTPGTLTIQNSASTVANEIDVLPTSNIVFGNGTGNAFELKGNLTLFATNENAATISAAKRIILGTGVTIHIGAPFP